MKILEIIILVFDVILLGFGFFLWHKMRCLTSLLKGKDLSEIDDYLSVVKKLLSNFEDFQSTFEHDFAEKKKEMHALLMKMDLEKKRYSVLAADKPAVQTTSGSQNQLIMELARMQASGMSDKEIAQKLNLSLTEVKTYLNMHRAK